MSRWPRGVYDQGEEPDPRFTMANERTFLAQIRTSLALLAAGVALEALKVPIDETLRIAVAVLFVVLAAALPARAWLAWTRAERALRRREALPATGISALVLSFGVIVAAVALLGGLLAAR